MSCLNNEREDTTVIILIVTNKRNKGIVKTRRNISKYKNFQKIKDEKFVYSKIAFTFIKEL